MRKPQKKRLPLGISEEFIAEVEAASPDQLKSMIVRFQEGIAEARAFQKEDPKVRDLKETYDQAVGPARETIRVLSNRTKMVLDTLRKLGG